MNQVHPKKPLYGGMHWVWRWLIIGCTAFVLFTVLQVVILRTINPPRSMMMLVRLLQARMDGVSNFRIHYVWCDYAQMAPSVPHALVAAEDQRFMSHHGFDFKAISRAERHNLQGGRVWGASTISQQVAKNVFLWQGRSWLRKWLEAWYTVLIEMLWPKRRILEVYANVAEFDDGVYGVQAAAWQFWRTNAAALTLDRAALLAAVLPAPRRYAADHPSAYVRQRAAWIAQQARMLDRSQVPIPR